MVFHHTPKGKTTVAKDAGNNLGNLNVEWQLGIEHNNVSEY